MINPLRLFGEFLGLGETYIKGKQEIKLKKQEAKAANQIRTLEDKSEWEVQALKSSMFLRWIIMFHIFALVDASVYLALTDSKNPMVVMDVLDQLPIYVQGLLATIVGFAFGSKALSDAGAKAASAFIGWKGKSKSK